MLLTWLVQVQDKANMFTWTPILTIKGKLLTQHYTEITMEDVRAMHKYTRTEHPDKPRMQKCSFNA